MPRRRLWSPTCYTKSGRRLCYIPLSQGLTAVVDATHLPLVVGHTWYALRARNTHYACTHVYVEGKRSVLYLHRLIGKVIGLHGPVDHKNGNGVDCRSRNLRDGNACLNGANRKNQVTSGSAYKGVSRAP